MLNQERTPGQFSMRNISTGFVALLAVTGVLLVVGCGSGSDQESAAPDLNGGDVAAQGVSLGGPTVGGSLTSGGGKRKLGPGRCRSTRCR